MDSNFTGTSDSNPSGPAGPSGPSGSAGAVKVWLTTREAAALAGVTARTIQLWAVAYINDGIPMPDGMTARRRGRKGYLISEPNKIEGVIRPRPPRPPRASPAPRPHGKKARKAEKAQAAQGGAR